MLLTVRSLVFQFALKLDHFFVTRHERKIEIRMNTSSGPTLENDSEVSLRLIEKTLAMFRADRSSNSLKDASARGGAMVIPTTHFCYTPMETCYTQRLMTHYFNVVYQWVNNFFESIRILQGTPLFLYISMRYWHYATRALCN